MDSSQATTKPSRWRTLRRHFTEAFSGELEIQRRSFDSERQDHTVLKRQRDGYGYILLLMLVVLAPVDAYHFYTGQHVPAFAGLVVLFVFLANIWLLFRQREAFLSPGVMLVLTIALVVLSLFYGQSYSLYWMYPLLVALPVLLQIRWAALLGVLSGVVVMPLVFTQFDRSAAIIIFISMAHTWLISAWLMFAVSRHSRQLKDMALTDPLTGAYNRRYFEEQVRQSLDIWRRYQRPSTLLLMDIDHFKHVNDSFGHGVGDQSLKLLVNLIASRIRGVDTLCRYGGEEFAVLLSETSARHGVRLAEELRSRVEESELLPEGTLTISVGVTDIAAAGDAEEWLRLTDEALYRAKKQGRNRIESHVVEVPSATPLGDSLPIWR
ncbi:MAG: diguanylate cyclase (GGDEF)-like protein [Alcanivorax sp.]|jgi:diguanylate cyclase (GGDEF)-like protein